MLCRGGVRELDHDCGKHGIQLRSSTTTTCQAKVFLLTVNGRLPWSSRMNDDGKVVMYKTRAPNEPTTRHAHRDKWFFFTQWRCWLSWCWLAGGNWAESVCVTGLCTSGGQVKRGTWSLPVLMMTRWRWRSEDDGLVMTVVDTWRNQCKIQMSFFTDSPPY